MKKNTVLIFAGNLRFGGGVAVASSFIKELSLTLCENDKSMPTFDLIVSNAVYANLKSFGVDLSVFRNTLVQDFFGLKAITKGIDLKIHNYDLTYVVFGPLYSIKKPRNLVIGFAQPWIIYPDSSAWYRLDIIERMKSRIKYWIQKSLFMRADTLVVELPHVRNKLLSFNPSKDIRVVNGCIDSVFRDSSKWRNSNVIRDYSSDDFYIGVISKNYPHKNIGFYKLVEEELSRRGISKVKFYLTLSKQEFDKLGFSESSQITNIGPLSLDQCPDFYHKMDLVLFPTLLECFSGVCVETMFMNRPLIAFDFQFIRDICGDSVNYIHEGDVGTCVDIIERYINKNGSTNYMNDIVNDFGDSSRRSKEYLGIINSILR